MYIKYFKYVMEHKKNVFLECIEMSKQLEDKDKLDILIHAFTHDLLKPACDKYNINIYKLVTEAKGKVS